MTKKKRERKIQSRLRIELQKEMERLKRLKLAHPSLFRKCGKYPCCQAINIDGTPCNRAALTDQSYIHAVKCCYLCWQHALGYGVYALLKLGKSIATSSLDWDTYCAYYPEECEEILTRQLSA